LTQATLPRLTELRSQALAWREADLRLGRHEQLLGELSGLTDEHPLRERFHAQLMTALYRSGRQADALAAYHRLRRLLADELGVQPDPQSQRHYQQNPDIRSSADARATHRADHCTPPGSRN
jgi:DNA-binding SARP family transcriptional activator